MHPVVASLRHIVDRGISSQAFRFHPKSTPTLLMKDTLNNNTENSPIEAWHSRMPLSSTKTMSMKMAM